MGLKTMSLLQGAVTLTAADGEALVFAENGITIQNGVQLVVPADADYATRRILTAKYRPPVVDTKTGAYNKDKKSVSFVMPMELSTGQIVFNTIRIEREVHPSFSAASAEQLNKVAAQLLTDTDTAAFWLTGAMS